ncbi:class I SAM-dependent methyltransferase [Methylobacterium sp. J-090]|uniref:class I SAM-dependent methyltransferase n=1 Tax=Methylobacterium sp. J-090 TaxID=2836666 RepID=UPI001FBBF839|nr:class I SAM-dependent methyltransferase [Methylobacterium sp. J-090]MCJ2080522.1 class I SAM-dependent methyltransferase [Methylobacterium sp. J-090]
MHAGTLSLDAFLGRRSADRRLARLTHDVGLPEGRGLEFGAASKPTPLPEGLSVTYLDFTVDAHADLPDAVPVDYGWAGSAPLAVLLGRTDYDFAIACQVAHRVPNLLGWFRGIHTVLRPGGVINLSLPDRRYMADVARPDSTIGELVEADLLSYERPSPRQVFAHTYEARTVDPAAIWEGEDPSQAPRLHGEQALAVAQTRAVASLDPEGHAPCHCWVFTPLSFLDVIEEATRLGLFSFVFNQIAATEPGGSEFFVSMRRDVQEDPQVLRAMQEGAIGYLRAILQRQRRIAKLIACD